MAWSFPMKRTYLLKQIADKAAVHMVGVGGVGMAGVALLLRARGLRVSGCDAAADGCFCAALRSAGIEVLAGHAAGHIAASGADWVIRTAAVREDCGEIAAAKAAGLPVFRRGEVLPALLEVEATSVAVAGTHGKTTTTTLIAQLLRAAGRDPSWCIGGESAPLGAVAHAGAGGVMVVEADESDGTLALYRPDIAVVTNVEFDHMEHFESVEAFEACFATFIAAAGRRVVYCADDPRARRLGAAAATGWSYGFAPDASLRGAPLEDGRTMQVYHDGALLGALPLVLPGTHNALNLLAATAVCLELGVPFAAVASAAGSALALPRRRYETVCEWDGIRVISDYSHHPTEIAALVRTARQAHAGRLLAVFQPHRYTRTAALGADFPVAFAGVDLLVLTPVYAASEMPLEGGLACDLYAHFRAVAGGAVPSPMLATSLEQAWAFLRRELRTGDWLLVIGAGDVETIAHWAKDGGRPRCGRHEGDDETGLELSAASAVREDEPLGRKTTYGVGGRADCWVEAGSDEDVARVLRYCRRHDLPLRVLGSGSNMLVSDLGVRGVIMRLTGVSFQGIRLEGELVAAGGGVPLVRLQERLTDAGLSGLEFLEGVPGGVGGIVRMNGGAYGHEVRERILWIRGLNRDGEPCIVQADALEWGYRGCESLRELVVLEAGFRLVPGDPEEIRARRRDIAARRAWMNGLHCAGSVFRNPPGAFAGKLVEAAGLKGMRIGGAVIYPRHGNFVVAEAGACASDVLALIQRMEAAVRTSAGVDLVREVVCLQ